MELLPTGSAMHRDTTGQATQLRKAAEQIETQFLSTMMKSAGLGEMATAMGGGIGEEQFASFLRDAQASEIVASGGLGLAESLFAALTKDSA